MKTKHAMVFLAAYVVYMCAMYALYAEYLDRQDRRSQELYELQKEFLEPDSDEILKPETVE